MVAERSTVMSEYTREEILKMIEENGGPENLDLSGKDLSGIDLSKGAIAQELVKYQEEYPRNTPVWFWEETGGVNLQWATLRKINLWGAHLEGATLQKAHLQKARLPKAHLQRATLWGTRLEGACLQEAFLQEAILWEAHLEGANLYGAHFQGANLWGSHLQGAILQRAHLEKVDLSVAASLAEAYFNGAFLDQTRMRREQLGSAIREEIDKDYYEAKEAYLLLKNNFNQIGRYDDASWAYIKERQMEKKTHWPLSYALECYGESELPKEFGTWSRLVDRLFGGVVTADGSPVTWGEYLRLSLASFATIELAGVQAQGIAAQYLRTLEALTGISLLALLMFTLGNRISRS